MAVYIILTITATLLAVLVVPAKGNVSGTFTRQIAVNKSAVIMVFLLLFGVSACRIAVGNDYWVYRQYILFIAQDRLVATEFGFNWLVRLVQWLTGNDECYLIVMGIFSFGTVYFFVKAMYRQSMWFAASVFLLLTGGYYFLSLNSVRYYFALAIALYAMEKAIKKEWIYFLLLTLLGACFHKSILVILILYPLAKIKWKKTALILVGLGSASMIFLEDLYREVIFLFYPYYENSMFDQGELSVVNIAKSFAVVIFALIYYKKYVEDSEENRFYLNLQIGSLILYTFGSFIPEISRIGYYLNISLIFLIPGVLARITSKKQKWFFVISIFIAFVLYFGIFLHGAYDVNIRILPYRNWIFN